MSLSQRMERHILSVTEITDLIEKRLQQEFSEVWVQGQISNFRKPSSGHFYFVLKDENAQLRGVMFKFQNLYLRFDPQDGMEVICRGRIGVYAPRGEYQIVIDQMEPLGVGALQIRFEQIKARLEKEGFFTLERKRPLPFLPRRIAIITSTTGAAIQDMLRVITTKDPGMEVLIVGSRVQGEGAAEELAACLKLVNTDQVARPAGRRPLELVIIGRGGGSLEDLWAFNEEVLARAVFHSRLPVVSAVGHEIDFTISDMVADYRAATPTAAAELVASCKDRFMDKMDLAFERLCDSITYRIEKHSERVSHLMRLLPDPRRTVQDRLLRIDDLFLRLGTAQRNRLSLSHHKLTAMIKVIQARSPRTLLREKRLKLQSLETASASAASASFAAAESRLKVNAGRLQALSPLNTLARGFSITKNKLTGRVVTDAETAAPGDALEIMLHRGSLDCEVKDIRRPKK